MNAATSLHVQHLLPLHREGRVVIRVQILSRFAVLVVVVVVVARHLAERAVERAELGLAAGLARAVVRQGEGEAGPEEVGDDVARLEGFVGEERLEELGADAADCEGGG